MSIAEVEQMVAPPGTVDLVIVAQALHWFDLPSFYKNVRWVLKKPHGVIAAWCYSLPEVNPAIDIVLRRTYTSDFGPYWDAPRKWVDEEYKTIEFPFETVDGEGPPVATELAAEKVMEFEDYLTYLRSWSAYQTAKDLGVELLNNGVIEELERAWNEDGEKGTKLAKFPIHLKIGKVGNNI